MTTQIPPEPPQAAFFALDWTKALFPAIEANQGLISLVALGVALWFAVLEYRRANRASEDRREEFRRTVLALCDELLEARGEALGQRIEELPDTLDALLNAPPVAAAIVRATVMFRARARFWARTSGWMRPESAGAFRAAVAEIRNKIAEA